MRGHVISFLADGATALARAIGDLPNPHRPPSDDETAPATLPNTANVSRLIKVRRVCLQTTTNAPFILLAHERQVVFLGPKKGPDSIRIGRLNKLPELQVDFDKVILWLQCLKATSELYADIVIDNSPEARAAVLRIREEILHPDNIHFVDNAALVRHHRHQMDNVADVRRTGGDEGNDGLDGVATVSDVREHAGPLPPATSDPVDVAEPSDDVEWDFGQLGEMSHVLIDNDHDHNPSLPTAQYLRDMIKLFDVKHGSRRRSQPAPEEGATGEDAELADAMPDAPAATNKIDANADGEVTMLDAALPMDVDAAKSPSPAATATPAAPSQGVLPGSVTAKRVSGPVDEFQENHKLFAGAFPWLFPFGSLALPKGALDLNYRQLTLRQYTCAFGHEPWFYFLSLNQLMRTAVLRSTATLVSSPNTLRKFEALKNDPAIQARLSDAKANPESEAAKKLERMLKPLVRLSGGKVPYSAAERASGISKLLSLCHTYGTPTCFFTFAMVRTMWPQTTNACVSLTELVRVCRFPSGRRQ